MSDLTESHLAMLASGAYESPDISHEIAQRISPDWGVDRELSDQHSTVYRNENTKHTVISFRGTKDRNDLKTDALTFLGFGNKSKRFKDSNALTDRVISKYGRDNLELSSHSLGANINTNVAKNKGLPATNFSKGRTLIPLRNASGEKNIRAIGDVLSGTSVIPSSFSLPNLLTGGFGRIPSFSKGHPHSLQQFI